MTLNEGVAMKTWKSGYTTSGFNSFLPAQNGRHFADNIFECISLNENVWISFKISLKFVPKVPINNIPALVQMMAWRRPGDKPLSEPMMVTLLTQIFVTRPQWVNPSSSPPHVYMTKLGQYCACKYPNTSIVQGLQTAHGWWKSWTCFYGHW